MSGALAGTEMCVFDAYGTLFDFNSAVARHRAAIGPQGRCAVGDVAVQADPVHLAAQQHGRLRQVLAGDRRGARPLPGRSWHRRPRRARQADGRLPGARSFQRSAGDARPAETRGHAACHPVQRQSRDARPDGRGVQPRRPLRGGAERRCRQGLQARPQGLSPGRGTLRRQAGQGLLPVVQLLGRAWRGAFRLFDRLGESRRRTRRQFARRDLPPRSAIFRIFPPCSVFPDVLVADFCRRSSRCPPPRRHHAPYAVAGECSRQ